MQNTKIALSGKSGAGKTELARHLVAHLGIQRCSPGDIYRSLSRILFQQPTKELMNRLTVALRGIDPLCVTTAALRQANPRRGVVFDSMRFKDDYNHFKAEGYLLVRIECDAIVRAQRLLARGEVKDSHQLAALEQDPTETDLDEMSFDVCVVNGSTTLEEFLAEAFFKVRASLGENA